MSTVEKANIIFLAIFYLYNNIGLHFLDLLGDCFYNGVMKTFLYIVKGKVQGVFFRAHTKKIADQLGIKGTVRNTGDGNVEVFAQGTPDQIKTFEEYLLQGPPLSRVEDIYKKEIDEGKIIIDFSILY